MSTAHDAHAQTGEHDAHEAFTGEPVNVLPADEPRTPGWLPLLGLALFTGGAVVLLTGLSSSPADEMPAEAPPAAVPATAIAVQAAPPPPPAQPGHAQVEPVRAGSDQAKRIEQLFGAQVGAQPSARPQAPRPPQPVPARAPAKRR